MKTILGCAMAFAGLTFSVTCISQLHAKTPDPRPDHDSIVREEREPRVQIALLLDTSNSMDGLISQAKSQLWRIVNEFAGAHRGGKTPRLEVALFEYGNNRLSAQSGYIRQVTPFTRDLDRLSEELFALRTDGGDEYCGWVIQEAVRRLEWSSAPGDYKAIFIAGNEPFTQGKVWYQDACREAKNRDIVVNTIHCGSDGEGREGHWMDGAQIAYGDYLVINQDARVVDVAAPQDKRIAELNAKLNATYLAYGATGGRMKERQVAQDSAAASMPAAPSVAMRRVASKASSQYQNSGWDLVDAMKDGRVKVAEMKAEELPEPLRNLSAEEREAYVKKQATERAEIQKEIQALSESREKYVAEQLKGAAKESTLDEAILNAVRNQATKKEFQFKNN